MATELVHLLSEVQPNWGYPKWYHYIRYGKCTVNPEYKNTLWFVTIPRGQYQYVQGQETHWPSEEHTFFVNEKYANTFYFESLRRDVQKWSEVAQKVVVGNWCSKYECLWSERPVFSLTLNDGVAVKYGLCKTQPRSGDRELWFVSLNTDGGHTFLVDHVCANPEVIRILGSDWLNGWMQLCWCHLEQEIQWEHIGTTEDRLVTNEWALDSPFIPDTAKDALRVVKQYQQQNPK